MNGISVYCQSEDIVGEAPFWSASEQALYWIDIIGKSLHRQPAGSASIESWSFPELVCGAVPRHNGEVLVALCHTLGSFKTSTETFTPLLDIEPDLPGNRNNEMKCDGRGRLWLGTMQNNVNADGSGKDLTESSGNLYCIYPDLHIEKRHSGVGISNTLAWSPDYRCFYFADSMADALWQFDYDHKTGEISNQKTLLAATDCGVPDGSAMDSEGWLWNARFGEGCVLRISPDAVEVQRFDLPVTNPTSCAFGGPDLSTLFITSARFTLSAGQLGRNSMEGAVIALETGVTGMPVAACQI